MTSSQFMRSSGLAERARAVVAVAVVASVVTSVITTGYVVGPARADVSSPYPQPVADDALVDSIDDAPTPTTPITVELVTDDTAAAGRVAISLGAVVTGSVHDEVLQVSVPAGRVRALASSAAVEFARTPLVANRPPLAPTMRTEFGPVVGENVAAINVDDWHAAGITGAGIRVGIVDFFDLSLWNPDEHGPVPDQSHQFCLDSSGSDFCTAAGRSDHGVAVAEVIKDIAPGTELFLATVGTVSDLRAAIDWFVANGVSIMSRSLGAAFDGAGDGSGPLGATVDYAAGRGLTWFNSAGNDAAGSYGRYIDGVDASGYVDFLNGPGVDTALAVVRSSNDPGGITCLGLDGVRWSDFGKASVDVTDYRVEILMNGVLRETIDARQVAGAIPIEGQDFYFCASNANQIDIRIGRGFAGAGAVDIVEVGTFAGNLEHSQAAYSAAKPVVDSRNPALVAVGAVDPPNGSVAGSYSSQGPTNDGRVKPDISAPSCVVSSIYSTARYGPGACFNGTSGAAPAVAGTAALLLGRGLALSGVHLAALTKHLVVDLGAPGRDTVYGSGKVLLPPPPPVAVDSRPATYTPLAAPVRLLDTRADSPTPGASTGPHPQYTVVDVAVGVPGATAVAVSIVSVDNVAAGYVQAVPTLLGQLGGSSNLNVATVGQVQPNFAIVPVGTNNSISLYMFAGGNVVVDIMGSFTPTDTGTAAGGRFVAVDPVRVLDTRPESAGPVPPEWTPHRPLAGETVRVTSIPAGASAAVVNVVADQAVSAGFLRTQATGASGLTTSNGNYIAGLASGTLSVVPVGADGTISVFTNASTHIVADLMGYITGPSAAESATGLFVPVTPSRAYDSRTTGGIHPGSSVRTLQFTGQASPPVPAGASALSMNLTSDAATGAGFLTVFPADQALPLISNLNYPAIDPRANAGIVRLAASGHLTTFVNQTTHVIVDVNGYFTGSG